MKIKRKRKYKRKRKNVENKSRKLYVSKSILTRD